MLPSNGVQLAAKILQRDESVTARGFFEVLSRWTRLSCEGRMRRNYGTNPLISKTQRAYHPRAKAQISTSISNFVHQQGPKSTVSSSAAPAAASPNTDAPISRLLAESEPINEPSSTYAATSSPTPKTSHLHSPSTKEPNPAEDKPKKPLPSTPQDVLHLSVDTPTSSTEETKPPEETEPPLSHSLRTIMRTLPSSVVVVTSTTIPPQLIFEDPPFKKKYKNSRGMTLSSFVTLCLSPEPIVTFNIRAPSSTLQAIITSRCFLIHILDASPEAARIAGHFTKGNGLRNPSQGAVFRNGVRDGVFVLEREIVGDGKKLEKFLPLPRLKGPGVGKVLRCELLDGARGKSGKVVKDSHGLMRPTQGLIAVGDHVLVLGRVTEILGVEEESKRMPYGLSYVDGRYRCVGEAISVKDEWPVEVEKQKTP